MQAMSNNRSSTWDATQSHYCVSSTGQRVSRKFSGAYEIKITVRLRRPHWMNELRWVVLGIRKAPKEDLSHWRIWPHKRVTMTWFATHRRGHMCTSFWAKSVTTLDGTVRSLREVTLWAFCDVHVIYQLTPLVSCEVFVSPQFTLWLFRELFVTCLAICIPLNECVWWVQFSSNRLHLVQ